jgi:chaperonin GroES
MIDFEEDDAPELTERMCRLAAIYENGVLVREATGTMMTYFNKSGIDPLDVRVLVKPDPVEQRTAGGIILAAETIEKQEAAAVDATLIAVGANAFSEAKGNPAFIAPRPGDRVMIAKYGGVQRKGADGEQYRVMNDIDVVAVLTEGM